VAIEPPAFTARPHAVRVRMSATQFKFGDRLVHASRPEWGAGVVTSAQNVVQDGQPCQRVTIRFDRAGLKTLTTNIAALRYAEEAAPAPTAAAEQGQSLAEADGGWLATLEAGDINEFMARLPEPTRDPFASL